MSDREEFNLSLLGTSLQEFEERLGDALHDLANLRALGTEESTDAVNSLADVLEEMALGLRNYVEEE